MLLINNEHGENVEMRPYQILSTNDNTILFEGRFHTFKHCLEQAVRDKARLNNADLRQKNLSNATLDDGLFAQADFSGSNLTGANLSEAILRGAHFNSTDLYNTCFAYSDLQGCIFSDASFGGTDIAGSNISHAVFSTLSCFSLDFVDAAAMDSCVFTNPDGLVATMSSPPLVIKGASKKTIIFMDKNVKIGNELFDYRNGITFLKKRIGNREKSGTVA